MAIKRAAVVRCLVALYGVIAAFHGSMAAATYISATTSFEFDLIAQRTIGQTFSQSYKEVQQKSPQRVIIGSNAGTWETQLEDRFISRSLTAWTTEVKLTDPSLGDFGDITSSIVATLQFANPTNADVTFGVTASWLARMNITSDIKPEDLSDEIDIHAVSAYMLIARDQDRNVPAPWVDVSDAIRFGDNEYRKTGVTGFIFTVPAGSSSRSLSFTIFTGSFVTVVPVPSTLSLALLALCLVAAISAWPWRFLAGATTT